MIDKTNKSFNERKVAIITGANAGIGYALAERLLKSSPGLHLCLACRNISRVHNAVTKLIQTVPSADISIVLLDTSSLASVKHAAQEIKARYKHIDYLYLNAGTMKVNGVDWSYLMKGIFTSRAVYMLSTGEGLLVQEDDVTQDGMCSVFQTNLYGHYQLIKELEDNLGSSHGSSQPSQLIWTSSSNALRVNYDIRDLQHIQGKDPYSSSKFAMDVLSVGLNTKMNEKNVYSHTVCPGLVMSNITHAILPAWFWTLILPLIWLLRIFVPGMTMTASNGAKALEWLAFQNPVKLDPLTKFHSLSDFWGHSYVGYKKMDIKPHEGEDLLKELDKLDAELSEQKINREAKYITRELLECL